MAFSPDGRALAVVVRGVVRFVRGTIAEMATGEGKTLAAVLPACLEALTGDGVHVLTFNDYLARRDAAWMGRLYNALGMTTGVINSFVSQNLGAGKPERGSAYAWAGIWMSVVWGFVLAATMSAGVMATSMTDVPRFVPFVLATIVLAFAGRELVLEAYRHAVREEYRFYSYGDAMLIR